MNPAYRHCREKGSVVLIALCFVVVLGIALASYLAVSNQAMTLSNRSHQQSVSRQLAEMGLEQTLWSFNRNDWDPAVWTLTGTTATRDIVSPIKYANGIAGTIKVRVDNYDAYNRPSKWNSATNYRVGDLISYTNGMWYRCLQAHLSSVALAPPNLSYWADAPIPWMWSNNTSYKKASGTNRASTVFSGSSWYLCINDHVSGFPPNGPPPSSNWQSVSWASGVSYDPGDFVTNGGLWYLCIATNINRPPPDGLLWSVVSSPWEYQNGITYNFNDVVTESSIWYRCISVSSTGDDPGSGSSTNWQNALSGSWAWSSSISYNLNEVVYNAGSFYRCVLAHLNQPPPNLRYWSPDPLRSPAWDPGHQYALNDVVYQNGNWYLCTAINYGINPASPAALADWAIAPPSLADWNFSRNYNIGDVVNSAGNWFRCIATHSNQTTSNTSYWTPVSGAANQWNSATPYTIGSYVSYGGVWYHCISGNTNQNPNDTTYWSALGAPVIYAEGSAVLPDGSAALRTQLRAVVTKAALFPNAVAATSTVRINGAGTVDSYDGSASTRSSQGSDIPYTYNQTAPPFSSAAGAANVGSAAVLTSVATSTTAVSIGNATVRGYVAAPSATVSPYAPLWNKGGSAVLAALSSTGVDLNRVSRSPFIPQFDPLPRPNLSSAFITGDFAKGISIPDPTAPNLVLNLGTPGAGTPSRYYYDSLPGGLRLQSGSSANYKGININGPVILYINGWLRVQNGGIMEIKNTGSLEIHCNTLRTYGTGDGIFNRTSDPKKLVVISDSTSGSNFYLDNGASANNAGFCGVIYAPYITPTNGVEVRTGMTTYGALSAGEVTFNAEANFHYDTSLRNATFNGIDSPTIISEWRELTDQSEKAILP